jgi:hypothetical protein
MIQIENLDEVLKTLTDSINRVQKAVEGIPINLKEDYLKSVPKLMTNNANSMIYQTDTGASISEIASATNSYALVQRKEYVEMIFENTNYHATFVEFGTGRVGENQPHPNLSAFKFNLDGFNTWEYFVPSDFKTVGKDGAEGWWYRKEFNQGLPSQPFIFTTLHQVSEKLPKDVRKAYKKGLEVK